MSIFTNFLNVTGISSLFGIDASQLPAPAPIPKTMNVDLTQHNPAQESVAMTRLKLDLALQAASITAKMKTEGGHSWTNRIKMQRLQSELEAVISAQAEISVSVDVSVVDHSCTNNGDWSDYGYF